MYKFGINTFVWLDGFALCVGDYVIHVCKLISSSLQTGRMRNVVQWPNITLHFSSVPFVSINVKPYALLLRTLISCSDNCANYDISINLRAQIILLLSLVLAELVGHTGTRAAQTSYLSQPAAAMEGYTV